jgi:hypothetical protein
MIPVLFPENISLGVNPSLHPSKGGNLARL